MMNNMVVAVLMAASALVTAGPAAAQTRYYARERLVGMPPPVYSYSPVYAWSSCSSGRRTGTLSGCTRSDSVAVAKSLCSTSPATKTEACTPVYACDPIVAGRFVSGGGTTIYLGSSVERTTGWEQRAADVCKAAMSRYPMMTVCVADTYQGNEGNMALSMSDGSIVGGLNPGYFAAGACRAQ